MKTSSSLSPVRRSCRIECEAHQQALGAADPVLLHQPDFFRPAVERVERVEQILGKRRDLEKPLRQLALLDQRAGAPAAAVDHLLVGQHRLIDRIPVHLRLAPLDQAGAQEVEEHLLLVPVIGRIAGRDLAAPVERQPHRLQLRLHRRDVLVGPFLGMDLALDCRVLGRHAEGVPAHRMQHGKPHRPLHPRHHIAHGVIAHVAHMDAPRRIGEHLQHVVFWLVRRSALARSRIGRGEDAALFPGFLPAGLGLGGVVAVGSHNELQLFRLFQNSRDVTRKRTAGQRRAPSPHRTRVFPSSANISGRGEGGVRGRSAWLRIAHRPPHELRALTSPRRERSASSLCREPGEGVRPLVICSPSPAHFVRDLSPPGRGEMISFSRRAPRPRFANNQASFCFPGIKREAKRRKAQVHRVRATQRSVATCLCPGAEAHPAGCARLPALHRGSCRSDRTLQLSPGRASRDREDAGVTHTVKRA